MEELCAFDGVLGQLWQEFSIRGEFVLAWCVLDHKCSGFPREIVVCIYICFDSYLEIQNYFTKFFKEIC